MSDTRLRELERRWKETGSSDDEAAYLLERVRVGDLTQERLELAAYCGHEGAKRATGECSTTQADWPERLTHWGPGHLAWVLVDAASTLARNQDESAKAAIVAWLQRPDSGATSAVAFSTAENLIRGLSAASPAAEWALHHALATAGLVNTAPDSAAFLARRALSNLRHERHGQAELCRSAQRYASRLLLGRGHPPTDQIARRADTRSANAECAEHPPRSSSTGPSTL